MALARVPTGPNNPKPDKVWSNPNDNSGANKKRDKKMDATARADGLVDTLETSPLTPLVSAAVVGLDAAFLLLLLLLLEPGPTKLPASTSRAAGRYAVPKVCIEPHNGDKIPPRKKRLRQSGKPPMMTPKIEPMTGGDNILRISSHTRRNLVEAVFVVPYVPMTTRP